MVDCPMNQNGIMIMDRSYNRLDVMKKTTRLGVKIFFISALALWFSFYSINAALACPAAPLDFPLTQPDGTVIMARLWGDEWNNGLETVDGYTIIKNDVTSFWVYADLQNGVLVPAQEAGTITNEVTPGNIQKHLRPQPYILPRISRFVAEDSISIHAQSPSRKTLVLLIQFSDRPLSAGTTIPAVANLFFASANSLKSYFQETSYSQMEILPATETQGTANDGVMLVSLPYTHPNPGGNTSDSRIPKMVKDALVSSDSYIDYAAYDIDQDGAISDEELIIEVLVAGFEASYNSLNSPSVWAHYSSLDWAGAPVLDGKIIGSQTYMGGYAMAGELHNTNLATIGVLAHELGHTMNLPDLYDTTAKTYGVGNWSLMGYGVWNTVGIKPIGSTPALLDAWSKWYLGWIEPTPILGLSNGTPILQAETNKDQAFYLLAPNPNNVDWDLNQHKGVGEYFLIENRQLVGMDAGLPGCGVLVWHINENRDGDNTANQPPAPLVYLAQADNLYHLDNLANRGDAADAYKSPAEFNAASSPNSNFYNGSLSQVSMTGLSATCAAMMTADLSYANINPISSIISISPSSVNAAGAGFSFIVDGSNFISSSVVRWNNTQDLNTTYISDIQLKADVPASLITTAGTAGIQVFNPVPGGGLSTPPLTMTISPAGINPIPIASWLSPKEAPQGGTQFTLTLDGSNFVANSVIQWNGVPLPTMFIISTCPSPSTSPCGKLTAEISAALLQQAGLVNIIVSNPLPGGGVSAGLTFIITTSPQTFQITGQVTDESGLPMPDVFFSYGEGSIIQGSAANGYYTIPNLNPGSYTITPSKTGYSFTPANKIITIIDQHVDTQHFIAHLSIPTRFSISGRITDSKGVGIEKVSISIGSEISALTDQNGDFTIPNLPSGKYTVVPIKTTYTFSPASKEVEVKGKNVSKVTFSGVTTINSQSFQISGIVNDDLGQPIEGVTVYDQAGHKSLTSSQGDYALSGLSSGSYLVTAQKSQYVFSPYLHSVQVQTVSVNDKPFVGVKLPVGAYAISGTINDLNGKPVVNVLVSDSSGYTAMSGSDGKYSITGLPQGDYLISASRSGYTFSQNFTNPVQVFSSDVSGKDFQAIQANSGSLTISGQINDSSGIPVEGAYVEDIHGLYKASTDSEGNYTLIGLPAGMYMLKVAKVGEYLVPTYRTISLKSNITNINFTRIQQTYNVNSTADEVDVNVGDGVCASATAVCTLRAALQETNATAGGARIVLDAATYPMTIENPLLISNHTIIQGSDKQYSIIDNKTNGQLFDISSPLVTPIGVVFSQLTVQRSVGAGISAQHGLAYLVLDEVIIKDCSESGVSTTGADVTLLNSQVIRNQALDLSGGMEVHGFAGFGMTTIVNSTISNNEGKSGGVLVDGGLYMLNSTISHNTGRSVAGGILLEDGDGVIVNSTIAENQGREGAGFWSNSSALRLYNATIVKNKAVGTGNGDNNSGFGGGIYIYPGASAVSLRNTILSENDSPTGSPNCFGPVLSLGYNLLGDENGCTYTNAAGDVLGYDPGINGLAANGGATLTYALIWGSWAMDAGNPNACTDYNGMPLTYDQRGFPRPMDGKKSGRAVCDIGAFEYQPLDVPYIISGNIADEKGAPLVNVLVTLNNGVTTLTDQKGNYTIKDIGAGEYMLSAAKAGYAFSPMARPVTVPPNASKINFVGLVK